jgi:hypothetical protein
MRKFTVSMYCTFAVPQRVAGGAEMEVDVFPDQGAVDMGEEGHAESVPDCKVGAHACQSSEFVRVQVAVALGLWLEPISRVVSFHPDCSLRVKR